MDLLGNLALGFGVAATAQNLALCFVGCLLGTAIGFILMLIPIAGLSSFDAETLRGALAGMTGGMAVALLRHEARREQPLGQVGRRVV